MVTGLQIAQALKIRRLLVWGDSKLVIEQIRGDYGVKSEVLMKYHTKKLNLTKGFEYLELERIPRSQNEHVDHLSRLATTYFGDLPSMCMSRSENILLTWKAAYAQSWKNSRLAKPDSSIFGGIDLVGQFLEPPVKYKDVVVAVDYFSKWVETAPSGVQQPRPSRNFFGKHITRYGVPKILVSDNGPQFDSRVIKEMCARLGIEHRFSPICYHSTMDKWRTWTYELEELLGKPPDHTWHGIYLKKYYV
ncbi:hypothetical protein LIER_39505 [Lithospermum erythrorhizon]|uniref:Integrase catalytic domain-containing protein n=1 Tax=Lithospermum erythrorhizon TaxID=34254 RepID=A0AAV3QG25_LITER